MISPVVVVVNTMKPFTHASAPHWGQPLGAVVSGFFIAPTTSTVLHTIESAPDCGSVEEKRFTLTQGGRVHEGSAPSDKQTCRLMVDCCRDKFSGLINKAADSIKGIAPMLTPTRVRIGTLTNHHPYRSPCMEERKT
jgi:hypothetical protein